MNCAFPIDGFIGVYLQLHSQLRYRACSASGGFAVQFSASVTAIEWSGIAMDRRSPPVWDLIAGDGTPKNAFLTALGVGTVLTLINHGDVIYAGGFPPPIKVLLTYCVPYCVTTWGAVTGKRAEWIKQNTHQYSKRR